THLRTPEESLAANMEGNARSTERLLESRQLGVRPDEHGHRAVRYARSRQAPDRVHDGRRLGVGSAEPADLGTRSGWPGRDQPFRWPGRTPGLPLVDRRTARGEHAIRKFEHLGRRAIVPLERDEPGLWV